MKLNWSKRPSTTRTGKSFYTAKRGETRYWVTQSWTTNRWSVDDSHGASWGDFTTATKAMRAVERTLQ